MMIFVGKEEKPYYVYPLKYIKKNLNVGWKSTGSNYFWRYQQKQ